MKKLVIMVLLLLIANLLYAKEVNLKENGTILYNGTIEDKPFEVRKFEISRFSADLALIEDHNIYDNFYKKNKIGSIEHEKNIDIYEICFISNDKKDANQNGELWVKLSDGEKTGWIDTGLTENPYANGHYSCLGSIKSGSKSWIIRKYDNYVSYEYWKNTHMEIRDNPGSYGKIIAVLNLSFSENPEYFREETVTFRTSAIADNENNYDDERWLKIEYEKNKFGWFNPSLSDSLGYYSPGGGPIFDIPEDEILWLLIGP